MTSLIVPSGSSDLRDARLLLVAGGLGGGSGTQWSFLKGLANDGGFSLGFVAPVARELVGRDRSILKVKGFGAAIARELDTLVPRTVTLVCHSVGTFVAVSVAAQTDHEVEAIVSINGGLDTVGQFIHRPVATVRREPATCATAVRLFALLGVPMPSSIASWFMSHPLVAKLVLAGLVSSSHMNLETIRAVVAAGGSPETIVALVVNRHHWQTFLTEAERVFCPVHILYGSADRLAPAADAARFAHYFKNGCTHELDAVGHAGPLEAPEIVGGALRRVLLGGPCSSDA